MKRIVSKGNLIIILLLSLIFVLSSQTIAFADTWSVSSNKVFTVKFNQPIDISTLQGNIFIEDSMGNVVNTSIEAKENVVKINAPSQGYEPGEYVIKILDDIKSKTNNKMKRGYATNFVVLDSKAVMNSKLIVNSELAMEYVDWIQEYNISKNKDFQVDIDGDGHKEELTVGMDSPNGTKVSIYKGNRGSNLMYDASVGLNAYLFEGYGDLNKGCMLQVCFFDFNKDGIKEIIIAAGDRLTNLSVSIFQYNPLNSGNPYKEIGYIEGQEKIIITTDREILVPYGSQGLFELYEYNAGKIEMKY